MKKLIAPSILAADFTQLARDLALVGDADWLHVDVMDGHFVPNISLGPPVIESIRNAFPELYLDVHLMVERPGALLDAFIKAGANGITIHAEADTPEAVTQTLKDIRTRGLYTALSLRPATPLQTLVPYLPLIDMVLLMTVEPGFGGQALLDASYDRIRDTRALLDRLHPDCRLQVDGGVGLSNLPRLVEAGADVFVAGTSVFRTPDVPETVRSFLRVLRG